MSLLRAGVQFITAEGDVSAHPDDFGPDFVVQVALLGEFFEGFIDPVRIDTS